MMTNAQLWVVIAVPSTLALIGILLNLKGVSEVKAELKSGLDAVNHRLDLGLDAVNHRLDLGLDAVNHRLERVEDRLLSMLVDHEQRITRSETRLESK